MGVQVRVDPNDQFCLYGFSHGCSSCDAMLVSGTGLEGNPAAIL
jgi:hypothetical protein